MRAYMHTYLFHNSRTQRRSIWLALLLVAEALLHTSSLETKPSKNSGTHKSMISVEHCIQKNTVLGILSLPVINSYFDYQISRKYESSVSKGISTNFSSRESASDARIARSNAIQLDASSALR